MVDSLSSGDTVDSRKTKAARVHRINYQRREDYTEDLEDARGFLLKHLVQY